MNRIPTTGSVDGAGRPLSPPPPRRRRGCKTWPVTSVVVPPVWRFAVCGAHHDLMPFGGGRRSRAKPALATQRSVSRRAGCCSRHPSPPCAGGSGARSARGWCARRRRRRGPGRRTAAATRAVIDDDEAQVLPRHLLLDEDALALFPLATMIAARRSSIVSIPTATPLPCSPRAGLTTTEPCFWRNSASVASSPASTCSGTLTPARSTMRRVTALSSQIDTATPVVSSESASRQCTERPP